MVLTHDFVCTARPPPPPPVYLVHSDATLSSPLAANQVRSLQDRLGAFEGSNLHHLAQQPFTQHHQHFGQPPQAQSVPHTPLPYAQQQMLTMNGMVSPHLALNTGFPGIGMGGFPLPSPAASLDEQPLSAASVSLLPTNLPFSAFLGGPTSPGGTSPTMQHPQRPQLQTHSRTSFGTGVSSGSVPSLHSSGSSSASSIQLNESPMRPTRSMSLSHSHSSSLSMSSLHELQQQQQSPGVHDPGLVHGMASLGMSMAAPQATIQQQGLVSIPEPVTPLPLGPSTVGSSASRSLLRTFASHAARFGFPRHALERLPHVTPALLESIYALACRVGGPSALSLAYDVDTRSLERSFMHRAEAALAKPDDSGSQFLALELVQTQCLLAHLMYILDRPLDGHRHAGGAMRLATSLRLHHTSVADERAETWWMVYGVDRAWAGVFGAQPSTLDEGAIAAPFPNTVPQPDASLHSPGLAPLSSPLESLYIPPAFGINLSDRAGMGGGESLSAARFKMLALFARTFEIIGSATMGRPLPQAMISGAGAGLEPFSATLAALERLLIGVSMMQQGPAVATVRLQAYSSTIALNAVTGNAEAASLAARDAITEISSLLPNEVDMLDPIVAFCLANIQRAWRELNLDPREVVPLDHALERLSETLPYVASHRFADVSMQNVLPMQSF
ncbi:hypothetical protein BKA62DRAFT_775292 [Auriculariales sp. MPI-PUGE-AT-0066]|nr:hypothetical protein BKA62DRAFT_775292 [Auriculariales sp. MPI-PUGE-AT-0066]